MHSRILLVALVALWFAGQEAAAQKPGVDICRNAIAMAEQSSNVPDRLMQAISIQESGRRDPVTGISAWPWTVNIEGAGQLFDTKQEAINAVRAAQARGAKSIDVGCMQVNLMYHPDAFGSLEEAFDPIANTRYAAQFLQRLLDKTGSWPLAVAGYHSLTPDIGGGYMQKVLAIWARPNLGEKAPAAGRTVKAANGAGAQGPMARATPVPAFAGAPSARPANVSAMPASLPARLLPMPGSAGSTVSGRGLDAYRAMPTQLTAIRAFRRF